jgi:NTE family protein
MSSNKKIGIAFSGGGVRGIAHLGVLKALQENGIFPDRVSGTSAGAIVGAMHCYGHSPEEIVEIIIKTKYFKFVRPAISWTGLLKMDIVEDLYQQYLPENFAALKIPLTVAATDLNKGKVVYFSEGPLIRTILASSCIPGMFDPISIDGRYFVDGGILNNMPVEPLDGTCDVIIGVNCNQLPEVHHNLKNFKSLIERTVIMSMNYNVYSRKYKCDYFIEPPGLAKYGVFDVKKSQEIFESGYQETLRLIQENEGLQELSNISSIPKKK